MSCTVHSILVVVVVCAATFVPALGKATTKEERNDVFDALVSVIAPAFAAGKAWGNRYNNTKHMTLQEKVDQVKIIGCTLNAAGGAGIAALPAIPGMDRVVLHTAGAVAGSLGSSVAIQTMTGAAIAAIRGYDVNDWRVQYVLLVMLLGDGGTELLKPGAKHLGVHFSLIAVKSLNHGLLVKINKVARRYIGKALLSKYGKHALINLAQWTPYVGSAVSAAADGLLCYCFVQVADNTFFAGAYKSQDMLKEWLIENEFTDVEIKALLHRGWNMKFVCMIDADILVEAGFGSGAQMRFLSLAPACQ